MSTAAVKIFIPTNTNAVQRTVASATQISGGTLLKLSDPNTAAEADGVGQPFGGIAAAEKATVDGDVSTSLAAYMDGDFDIKCSTDVVPMGAAVIMSGANLIKAARTGDVLSGAVVGYAKEAGASGEVIVVSLVGRGV